MIESQRRDLGRIPWRRIPGKDLRDSGLSDLEAKLQKLARGAPQSRLSRLIWRISARKSVSICRRPPLFRDFHRKSLRNPTYILCQRTSVSGRTI
jgi:hypothetical protein